MKKRDLATDEGETLPPIDMATDVGRALYMLEYARLRGFKLGPRIQVGDVVLEVSDLRQVAEARRTLPEKDIYEEHGYNPNPKE